MTILSPRVKAGLETPAHALVRDWVPQLCRNKMSSRAIPPAAISLQRRAKPLARSRIVPAMSRNPASSASLVTIVPAASVKLKVPKPSAGIGPAPCLSGTSRRPQHQQIPSSYPQAFLLRIPAPNSKLDARSPQAGPISELIGDPARIY